LSRSVIGESMASPYTLPVLHVVLTSKEEKKNKETERPTLVSCPACRRDARDEPALTCTLCEGCGLVEAATAVEWRGRNAPT
jgi:hypothetical protein